MAFEYKNMKSADRTYDFIKNYLRTYDFIISYSPIKKDTTWIWCWLEYIWIFCKQSVIIKQWNQLIEHMIVLKLSNDGFVNNYI